MTDTLEQNVAVEIRHPVEDSVRIIASRGVFHVSLKMDRFLNFSCALIPFVIWLDSLDEAARVEISVVTPRNTPAYAPSDYLTLINALQRCKAHVAIKMDHYEPTQASYLYLAAKTVIVYPAGAIFFGPIGRVEQNNTQEIKPISTEFVKHLALSAKARGFLSDRECDAICKSMPIGLTYKDIISRDLSTVGSGVDLRE